MLLFAKSQKQHNSWVWILDEEQGSKGLNKQACALRTQLFGQDGR